MNLILEKLKIMRLFYTMPVIIDIDLYIITIIFETRLYSRVFLCPSGSSNWIRTSPFHGEKRSSAIGILKGDPPTRYKKRYEGVKMLFEN